MASSGLRNQLGIRELYRPAKGPADIDIVAVHGLTGDSLKTWTFEPGSICWLNHPNFLPKYVTNARVLSWGYNANICSFGGRTPSSSRILQHAQTLVAELHADRELEDANTRPIIFLCHSLGGIVVKQALIYSASRNTPNIAHLHTIYTCTSSIMFFGTPHFGTGKAHLLASLQKLASLALPKGMVRFETNLVEALNENSETLQNILDQFAPLMSNFHIFFFWEQEKTNLKYGRDYIVNETSAAPILDNTERSGIAADHREMCRFRSTSSPGFRTTMAALQRYCQEGPQLIKARCAMATAALNQSRWFQALETMNAIGTMTRNANIWNAARTYRNRHFEEMEKTSASDIVTANADSWEEKRLKGRQPKEVAEGNHGNWETSRLNRNQGLEKASAKNSELLMAERMNARKVRAPEGLNLVEIQKIAGNPQMRQFSKPNEVGKVRSIELKETFPPLPTKVALPRDQQREKSPTHAYMDPLLWFETESSCLRRSTQPPETVWRIFQYFFVGMLAGCLAYFLLGSF